MIFLLPTSEPALGIPQNQPAVTETIVANKIIFKASSNFFRNNSIKEIKDANVITANPTLKSSPLANHRKTADETPKSDAAILKTKDE